MDCKGLVGAIYGHNYQARYAETAVRVGISTEGLEGEDLACFLNAYRNRGYHGDVCTRCGDVVNQPEAASKS